MRDAVLGPRASRGSVPTVHSQATQSSFAEAPGEQSQTGYPAPGSSPPTPYSAGPASGAGGSFLGTAASGAASVIGGALLLDGIRSMFGHHAGLGVPDHNASPWGGSAADSDLARDAGIDHIGQGSVDAGDHAAKDDADSSDTATEEVADDDSDFDDGDNSDFGGDDGGTDYA